MHGAVTALDHRNEDVADSYGLFGLPGLWPVEYASSGTTDPIHMHCVSLRISEIMARPVAGSTGVRDFQLLHRQLFQGVYDWAGQRRDFDRPSGNGTLERFAPASHLSTAIEVVFDALADDNRLVGFERGEFLAKLAYHYDQVHYLHPFVAGNGIVEQLFWSQAASRAGYVLDWKRASAVDHAAAVRSAHDRDYSGLVRLFDGIAVDRVVAGIER